ncbi:MAG: glycosyltransferase family 39 protein [bacterium]|nr:glycosyltransferase family 39 protein [bacterium]
MQQKANSYKYQSLFIIIAIALLVRLFFLRFEYAAGWDEINYLKLGASGAIHGFSHVLHPYWSPLYPFTIALMGKVCPNYELAGRLVSIIFGTLLIVPVYFFSRKHFGRRAAILNSLLIAFFPALIESSTADETEPLYIFVAVTGILTGFSVLNHKSVFRAFVVGILFAFAYLTRPEGIGLYFVFIGILVCVTLFEIVMYRKFRSALILIVVTLGFVITSSPYLIYLKKTTGQWTISSKGTTNFQGEISVMENADKSDGLNPWLKLSKDNTTLPDDDIYHTGEFLKKSYQPVAGNKTSEEQQVVSATLFLIVKKFLKNFLQVIKGGIAQVLGLPILALIILGLWGKAWDKKRMIRDGYLLTYVGFFWFIVVPMFHFTERYMLPMVPIVLIWSGIGIEYLMEWFEKTWESFDLKLKSNKMVMLRNAFILIFIASLFIPAYIRVIARNPFDATEWAEPVEQKKAGLWLKKYCGNEVPVVMAWSHAVSFYAGNYNINQSITIPHNDLDRALVYAKYRGAGFLALNEKNKTSFPTINYLLDENQAPPELKLIYKDDSIAGLKTLIYEIIVETDEAINCKDAGTQS